MSPIPPYTPKGGGGGGTPSTPLNVYLDELTGSLVFSSDTDLSGADIAILVTYDGANPAYYSNVPNDQLVQVNEYRLELPGAYQFFWGFEVDHVARIGRVEAFLAPGWDPVAVWQGQPVVVVDTITGSADLTLSIDADADTLRIVSNDPDIDFTTLDELTVHVASIGSYGFGPAQWTIDDASNMSLISISSYDFYLNFISAITFGAGQPPAYFYVPPGGFYVGPVLPNISAMSSPAVNSIRIEGSNLTMFGAFDIYTGPGASFAVYNPDYGPDFASDKVIDIYTDEAIEISGPISGVPIQYADMYAKDVNNPFGTLVQTFDGPDFNVQ